MTQKGKYFLLFRRSGLIFYCNAGVVGICDKGIALILLLFMLSAKANIYGRFWPPQYVHRHWIIRLIATIFEY